MTMGIPDVLALSLARAREILEGQALSVVVLESGVPGGGIGPGAGPRVARARATGERTVELVVVYIPGDELPGPPGPPWTRA